MPNTTPPKNHHYDSRNIAPGDVFICLPGGERFIPEARQRGASDVLHMDRTQLGDFSNSLYETPSRKIPVIGVTGTNGKTTVTHLIAAGLTAAGYKPAILGTLNAPLTTPESLYINKAIAEHIATGGTHFIMEVSSHAIAQNRIAGLQFAIKLLTNITQDHLDYHQTFEAYRDTKLGFMASDTETLQIYPETYQTLDLPFAVPLPGTFNYRNFQAALSVLRALNIADSAVIPGLKTATAPPGRFESVLAGQPFLVIVDYAHTPDGLENVLKEIRILADTRGGKARVLFGCGGDRDRGKRPQMAAIAAHYADHVVVTSDNPRTESPQQIFADIITGFSKDAIYEVIEDRRAAIAKILAVAHHADVVLLAGKGHETVQIFADQTLPFDDRAVAREALSQYKKT